MSNTPEAINKLKAEMDSDKNPYVKVIGDYLLEYIKTNTNCADKILAEGKTIAKSLDAMKTEAKKKQSNGMAMLTDEEGYAIVLKYFGIKGEVFTEQIVTPVSDIKTTNSGSHFSVSLDEFL